MSISVMPAWADNDAMPEMDHSMMEGMDHGTTQEMDHSTMPEMDHSTMEGMNKSPVKGMDHNKMEGMNHGAMQGSMQGGPAPADARDPHAWSDGYSIESGEYALPGKRLLVLADEHNFGSLLVDRMEAVRTSDTTIAVYDLQAWYGRDYDRLVFTTEVEVEDSKLEEASTELLWSHAVSTFWNTQTGIRFDNGEDPNRSWLAFGVQGLAPYWFEMDITAYLGTEGRSALSLEAEYELLFTQKLILQPRIEMEMYGKEDKERGTGTGLSSLSAGLRLRYEVRREFAPYIGIERTSVHGDTASMANEAGQDSKETRAVAGVRMWF